MKDPVAWSSALNQTRLIKALLTGFGYEPQSAIAVAAASSTGDAAWTFDPLSAQGILQAMISGRRAAAALIDQNGGSRSASITISYSPQISTNSNKPSKLAFNQWVGGSNPLSRRFFSFCSFEDQIKLLSACRAKTYPIGRAVQKCRFE